MRRSGKRLLAALLVLVLVLGLFPAAALAAEPAEAAQGSCQVTIYAAVQDLTLKDKDGKDVPLEKGTSGDYTTFTFRGDAGTYTYSNESTGTGMFRVTESTDIYLRMISYSTTEARVDFRMRIVNTEEPELVCLSPVTTDKQHTNVLVPAYGYNVRYQFFCEPADETYCGFYGNLWALPGASAFVGFKTASFNLSDGRVYNIGKKATVSFKIPEGATLKVEELVKFYRQNSQFKTTFVETKDGYDYYTAEAPTNSSGEVYYVVSKEGYMKKAHTFSPRAGLSITVDELKQTPNMHESLYEASIITNGNASKFISLQQGESFGSWSSRAWQAVNNGLTNGYLEPDKHYYVLDGDSVEVDEYGIVHAVKPGLSIVALTYDAMEWDDNTYGAINEDQIAVYAFMVDGNRDGVTTGLEGFSDLHSFYIASTVKVDGSDEVKTNESVPTTITPKAENGKELTVSLMNVCGYPTPKATGWEAVSANEDGSYTLNLKPGRNIVKVEAGDAMRCYVLGAVRSDVTVQNITNPGNPIQAGETVKVAYSNVTTPQPKLGAIYNPGYGNTTYLEGTLLDADGKEIATVSGDGTQYGIKENAGLQVIPTTQGEFSVDNVRIHLGAFGSAPGTHLNLSPQSEGGNYQGADSPESTNYWCYFQGVSFSVSGSIYPSQAAAVVEKINAIGEVSLTDDCKEKIDAARLAYDDAPEGVQNLVTKEQLKTLTDAEAAYDKLLLEKVGKEITKTTVDGVEYYVITNADELFWFANYVKELQDDSDDAGKPVVNARLANDITVNENVLDASGKLTKQNGWRQWLPIGGYEWTTGQDMSSFRHTARFRGVFDGQGHTISGLVSTKDPSGNVGLIGGLFGGTVKNVKVVDSYLTGGYTGGIVGRGNNETVENVSYSGYVSGSTYTGGIMGYTANAATVRGAQFDGTLYTTGEYAGGIVGSASGATIENCSVNAKLTGSGYVGGILGHSFSAASIRLCSFSGSAASLEGSAAGILAEVYSGSIENCYSTADLTAAERTAGIVLARSDSFRVRNCYALGTMDAKETFGISNQADALEGPSYCSDVNASTATGNTVTKTADEFRDGTVAWLLGESFGQTLGVDAHPVFANGSNRVFKANGVLRNVSAETCDLLIDAIGTVAADGSENCFENVTLAQTSYDMLSRDEQAKVTKLATLTQKQQDYTTAVNALIAQIGSLGKITLESKDALDRVQAAYDGYLARGGDAKRITNADVLAAAQEEYQKCVQASDETRVEQTIGKRTIDGAEYYELSNLEQLKWYLSLLNGTLNSKPQNDAANAILTADITVNENLLATLLDENGAVRTDKLSGMTQLPIVENMRGTFDGGGHVISGLLYCYSLTDSKINEIALFRNLYGTVKDVVFRDAYVQGWNVGGIAYTANTGAQLLRCGFEGRLYAKQWLGGLLNYANGTVLIQDCYCFADMELVPDKYLTESQSFRLGGIACQAYGATQFRNCYVAGSMGDAYYRGGIAAILGGNNTVFENCAYPEIEGMEHISDGSKDRGQQTLCEPIKPGMLTNGQLAYKLGDAFGQRIGTDTHPVFRTADNAVFLRGGVYANASAETAIALIDEIGTVALNGSENCFSKLAAANECYTALSASEQAKVTNAATLNAALAAENTVVSGLIADINAVTPMTLAKLEQLDALTQALNAYTERGGDLSRIGNYADYTKALTDADRLQIEDTEKSMKTEQIDGVTYYVIENAAQLNWFARLVNGTLPTGTAQNAAANAILKNDITINERLLDAFAALSDPLLPGAEATKNLKTITPIGSGAAYTGTFDGQGHTISGLYLPAGEVTNHGLFAQLSGTVKNLHVRDSYVGGTQATRVGGLAGYGDKKAVLEDCSFEGTLVAADTVGGLVGYYAGALRHCRTQITIATYSMTQQKHNSGGLVGYMTSRLDFINSYAQGTIYCNKGNASATYFGGLAGNAAISVTAKNCYAAVNFIGTAKNVGGLNGAAYGTKWSNCYSYSNVKAFGGNNSTGKDIANKGESKSLEEFKDGTVLKLLGDAFGQRIGKDTYPVFASTLPTATVTAELSNDTFSKGDTITVRVYLTGVQTADTIGYSLTYDAAQMTLSRAEAGAGLTAEDRSADGKLMRTLTRTDGAALAADADGRILVDTLTFTAKQDMTADFGLEGVAGDATFGTSPAFVQDDGFSVRTVFNRTYAATAESDRAAAAEVDALIEAIGTVTTESKSAINAARLAYNRLTDRQKTYVEHYDTLTAAEETYRQISRGTSGGTTPVTPAKQPEAQKDCDGGANCPSGAFRDVRASQWYHDAVDYVVSHGLMNGTGADTFSPNDALTRGMFVTMLYRMEGKPAVTQASGFTDVARTAYYADAVAWASANGIVYGTSDTTFSPDAKITREQMAAMMRRYAAYKQLDTSARASITNAPDASSVSGWALADMQWAVASELMLGNTRNELQPTANATRAQAAAILQRFAEKLAQ